MDKKTRTRMSKTLTYILRHNAAKMRLPISSDGYVRLEVLNRLSGPLMGMREETLRDIVANCEKQRFQLREDADGGLSVRAAQGHSMGLVQDDKLLEGPLKAEDIPLCVHGTFMKFWPSIKATGLKKMTRNHIHFAVGLPGSHVMSGARTTANVAIFVDVPAAIAAGVKFYRSSNGVILSAGLDGVLPPAFFQRVVQLDRGKEGEPLPFARTGYPAGAGDGASASAGAGAEVGATAAAAAAGAGAGAGSASGAGTKRGSSGGRGRSGSGAGSGSRADAAAALAGLIPGTREYAMALKRVDCAK